MNWRLLAFAFAVYFVGIAASFATWWAFACLVTGSLPTLTGACVWLGASVGLAAIVTALRWRP